MRHFNPNKIQHLIQTNAGPFGLPLLPDELYNKASLQNIASIPGDEYRLIHIRLSNFQVEIATHRLAMT
jgi:hypothetical protein